MDQLLAAAIPAGIVGGFVLGPPSLAAAHLLTPDFSSMQQHEQEEA